MNLCIRQINKIYLVYSVMRNLICFIILFLYNSICIAKNGNNWTDDYNIVWESPSNDASESMPLGGGDLGCNVWVEPSGDLFLYIQKSGGEKYSTNGRMELKAVVEGLSLLREPCVVTIICDSKYVCDSIDVYLQGWIDKGFKDVKHTDLWGEYMRLTSQNKIITKWVKAHSGHSQNEHCDRVAKENARYYQ